MSKQITLRPGEYERVEHVRMTFETLERTDYRSAPTVWVLTTGRSGTSWLTDVLNQVEGFRSVHEPAPSLFYEGRLALEGQTLEREAAKRMLRVARGLLVRDAYHSGQVYVETSPFLAPLAVELGAAFQGSRFVHLVRDVRSFVRSALPRKWMQTDHYQSHWWPRNCPYEEPWQRLVWFWAVTHRLGLEAEARWGERWVRRVRSEDLWRGDAMAELLTWLEVPQRIVERHAGVFAEAREKRVNEGSARAEWDPAWDAFVEAEAGDVLAALAMDL